MPFRKHDPRRRAQANGVHLSTSSASLSSFSSSSDCSILPAAPPSGSSQSDLATPDQSVHTSPTSAHKSHLPPDTILPVPRSSSLIPTMGQAPSRSQLQQPVPPPSPTVPMASGGAGSRLKRVFGGRRKKSEDVLPSVPPTLGPVPMPIGKSRSVMTPASYTTTMSPSAPKLPHQPTVSAGPSYYTSPFIRHVSPERQSISSSNPAGESPQANMTLNPPSSPDQEDVGNVIRRPEKRYSDHDVMKEDWRKSDSTTTSYYTVRPRSVASGGARTPRPVSMAESLHSTNTVVPGGKRLSALLTEAEFIMTEEDVSDSNVTPLSRKTSPSGSSKCKRHSISLSFASPLPSNQVVTSAPSSEAHSSRPGFKHRPSGDVATLSKAAASGIIGPSHGDNSQSTGSHIKGNLAAWTAATIPPPTNRAAPQQLPSSPSEHGSLRQTAISMTGGLAPAAGFAMGFGKRAVERMGRAFGNLGSSHSSSGHSSSSSLAGTDDFGRNASNLSLASHASQTQSNKSKPRRTPNAPSGAWSVNTVSSTSTGQTEPESFNFTGPLLGICLRGPMRNSSGSPVIGGLVFGRDLKICADETAIDVIRLAPPTSDSSHTVSPVLHERRLPALVVRCAQHLMKWGIEEEGLFRVSGRATHVAKLRSEFDTGADFDMLECAPSDLDPHAVASVFKTYLRELPEPILTHALNPYFEAAMLTETNARKSIEEQEANARKPVWKGPSLPSGPRDSPSLRKPPSLSTLALPNFSSMRPPSQPLLNTFASLLARLPRENRDLLRTVIDVINFVARRKEIRMPLSNLTVVLCPTLNMSPPIFRVLCEAEGIWNGPPDDWVDDNTNTNLDLKGDILHAAGSHTTDNRLEQDSATEPSLPQGDHQSIAIGALDTRAEKVSGGGTQYDFNEYNKEMRPPLEDCASYLSASDSRPPTPALGKGSPSDPWSPPALTSSSDSLTTPSISSESPSILQMTVHMPSNACHIAKENLKPAVMPDFVRSSPAPSSHSVTHAPVTFPRTETAPGTPASSQHSSHLPSLSVLPLESDSPNQKPKRLKRPSLTALFSKKSISSLRSSRLFSSSSSSSPYFDACDSPSRSTPASPRTPISPSIISAPSLLPRRSSSSLPPLLNTQIDSSSLSLAVGLDEDQPKENKLTSLDSGAITSKESLPVPGGLDASLQPLSTSPITPVTMHFRNTSELPKPPVTQPEPLQSQLSDDSFVSVASAASYHRLSLWEDVGGDPSLQDDWARDMLTDFGWSRDS